MTFREKIQQERPECVKAYFDGGVAGCPSQYGLASRASEEWCDQDCAACWDRETETDADRETIAEGTPHQSPMATASPQGEAGEAEGLRAGAETRPFRAGPNDGPEAPHPVRRAEVVAPYCLTCPAAYWESGPRGYDMLRCSLGGIREESGTPIVYINDTRLAPPAPESSAAPAWCKRRLGLDLCR